MRKAQKHTKDDHKKPEKSIKISKEKDTSMTSKHSKTTRSFTQKM